MTNGAARGTRQPMFLCKRGMQAHKSEIMERRQERSVGVRWRCLGAAGHSPPGSRRLNPQSALWGPRGGRARADLCAPTPAGASFFCLASTQQSLRETPLGARSASVCVCALCYINLIVTRWETLVRKKACARCLSPGILMLKSFFSLALCVYVYDSQQKNCATCFLSLGL
jgi:hypothetical protein